MVEKEVREKTSETDGHNNQRDIRQGMVKRENEKNERIISHKKIIEAKGEARGTTFTGFTSCSRLDRGILRDLLVSGFDRFVRPVGSTASTRRARVTLQNVNVP